MFERSALAAGLALVVAGSAGATGVGGTPVFSINGDLVDADAFNCEDKEGPTSCAGEGLTPDGKDYSVLNWNFAFDPDPSVLLFFAIQNNSASDQSFVFTASLPVPPAGPQVIAAGSIGGSITDANGNGATLTDNGSPIYTSIIDGVLQATLLDPPQSFTAGAAGSQTVGPAAFGPTLVPDTVDTFIGIMIQFTLSPGDIASFTSVFNVEPIPEPGTLVLLGSGLIGLVAYGRRRVA